MTQYGASILLVQLAIACSPSAPEQNSGGTAANVATPGDDEADQKLVVVFGDSLYAGYGLGPDEGFAPVLERALGEQGVPARVVNAGVSGDTSAEGLGRLAFVLDGLTRKPDLLIVGLGGNDMLRGLDPGQTRANLDEILAVLKQRGVRAMLTGMVAAPNMGRDYAAKFNAIYPDLARTYGVPLYPFFLDGVIGKRQLMLPDGIHPNKDGVGIVVGHVAPLVAGDLKD
jgi:acyl-CoA thioesterase-1